MALPPLPASKPPASRLHAELQRQSQSVSRGRALRHAARLLALVGEKLSEDFRTGALFVFTNRDRRLLKALYWDGTGLWLLSKRLERGCYSWPKSTESGAVKIKLTPEAFAMLTDGIDLRAVAQRAWYERE